MIGPEADAESLIHPAQTESAVAPTIVAIDMGAGAESITLRIVIHDVVLDVTNPIGGQSGNACEVDRAALKA